MRFAICEMSGRTCIYDKATDTTTVKDARAFAANMLNLSSQPERVILILKGQQLKDDDTTLVSLGLSADEDGFGGAPYSLKMHALVKFQAPKWLFDGTPHPFPLNGIAIGGDQNKDRDAATFSMVSFAKALAALKMTDKIDPTLAPPAAAAFASLEKETLLLLGGGGGGGDDAGNATLVQQLESIEATNKVTIPSCVKAFLFRRLLREAASQRLAFSPFIVHDFGPNAVMWDCPTFVRPSDDEAGLVFMGDQQGCCYWYAMWDPTATTASEKRCSGGDDHNAVSVYVIFGGQEFDLSATTFLTSTSFWRFLTEYAEVSGTPLAETE